MSGQYVRDTFLQFLADNSTEKIVDIDGETGTMRDLLAHNNINHNDNWVAVQFVGSVEEPISIDATNANGKYREIGSIYIHVVAKSSLGVNKLILPRATALQNLLRGRRISNIVVEDIVPPNFGSGGTLEFEGGYTSASIIIGYHCDKA